MTRRAEELLERERLIRLAIREAVPADERARLYAEMLAAGRGARILCARALGITADELWRWKRYGRVPHTTSDEALEAGLRKWLARQRAERQA